MSTGWNEVSLRLSKPAPNSICGTEHEPKSSIALDELAAPVDDAAAAVVVAATLVATAAADEAPAVGAAPAWMVLDKTSVSRL